MPRFGGTATVRVRVPATSANLGPGFDALGLALDIHDEVSAAVTGGGLAIEVSGEGADLARDESHLVVRAMRATFDRLGGQPPGLELRCVNRIPHSRGLGSSAAAIVAGVWLARGLVEDPTLADLDALALAAEIEGHPDNVAACALGGLTVAWADDTGFHAVTRPAAPVYPVLFVPSFTASTELARGLLPERVPHADAAANAGRAALLVAALTGSPEQLSAATLFAGTEDRLHQAYREPAMPESIALVARLRAAGHAAVVSGAGPTVLVLAPDADSAQAALRHSPDRWWSGVRAVGAGAALS